MIELNNVLIDYLTVTTFSGIAWRDAREIVDAMVMSEISEKGDGSVQTKDHAKRMQYAGRFVNLDGGSIFAGAAMQGGTRHYMLQFSGSIAAAATGELRGMLSTGVLKATRMDIQSTIYEPDGISMRQVYDDIRRRSRSHSTVSSKGSSGELTTVYQGSRQSDRFWRVYQKEVTDDDGRVIRLLRVEIEIKGELAAAVASRIARDTHTLGGVFAYELASLNSFEVRRHFLPIVAGFEEERVMVVKQSSLARKERWINQTVLPFLFDWNRMSGRSEKLRSELLDALGGRSEV